LLRLPDAIHVPVNSCHPALEAGISEGCDARVQALIPMMSSPTSASAEGLERCNRGPLLSIRLMFPPGLSHDYFKTLIARDATTIMVTSEIALWNIISTFIRAVSGNISAGLKAVEIANA